MDHHLRPTALLDLDHPALRALVDERGWRCGGAVPDRAAAIYGFVRNEVPFGYNARDDLPASAVLADGYGQCNTKTILLMALLRTAGFPTRFRAASITRRLQRGVVPAWAYRIGPRRIVHSWAEVHLDGRWVGLEGVICDDAYLAGVAACAGTGAVLGWAVGTDCLAAAPVAWTGTDTWIQATGVREDLGVHDDPDAFYAGRPATLRGVRAWLFRHLVRPAMNRRVARVRARSAGRSLLPGERQHGVGEQLHRGQPLSPSRDHAGRATRHQGDL